MAMITVTLKGKDGSTVSVHTIEVVSAYPEVYLSNGIPYVLRRVLPGKTDVVANEPNLVHNFDAPEGMTLQATSWTVTDASERQETVENVTQSPAT